MADRRVRGRASQLLTLARGCAVGMVCSAVLASAGSESVSWYRAVSAGDTVVVCINWAKQQAARARVTVVDRNGHLCDVAGDLRTGRTADTWTLQVGPKHACALNMRRQGTNMHIADSEMPCQPFWCGTNVEFGARLLAHQKNAVRPACEVP